jgi:hypothetical protein
MIPHAVEAPVAPSKHTNTDKRVLIHPSLNVKMS